MVDHHGDFAWYELLTTDLAAARNFYGGVLGWQARDASTAELVYNLFSAAEVPVSGLMSLPEEGRRMGATPRWVGYVAVDDIDAAAGRIKRLGGTIYVPPTETNIGRISIVADPQTATLALVNGLKISWRLPKPDEPGRVGWHELLAVDGRQAFEFYGQLFNWQETEADAEPTDTYRLFSAGGRTTGGIVTKRSAEPIPFWLYYFNVGDIDAAMARVTQGGGQVFAGPFEVTDGGWVVRCIDPQGAVFALEGTRSDVNVERASASEFGWSVGWGGFSSRGRLLFDKASRKGRRPDPEK
jgi:predicted enzyme related to lactoylglutathione lyase